jgi:PleD family two-component response regulator
VKCASISCCASAACATPDERPDEGTSYAFVVIEDAPRLAATPLRYDASTRPLSASCGIVSIAAGESSEALKERADRALYEAKRQGRARFVVA